MSWACWDYNALLHFFWLCILWFLLLCQSCSYKRRMESHISRTCTRALRLVSWLPCYFQWTHCLDSLNARFSMTASLCFVWRCYYANGHLLGWTCRTDEIDCFGIIGCFSSTGLVCRGRAECVRAKSHGLTHSCSNHVKKRNKTGVCCVGSIPAIFAVLMCYWMV